MTIDWEQTHKKREWGIYPCEDLVRFVCKQPRPSDGAFALDIGCGAGSNVGLLLDAGYHVEGCDIAYSAVDRCRSRYPKAKFSHVDFMAYKPARRARRYELIVDVFSLAYLPERAHTEAIDKVYGMLNSGGWFFQVHPTFGFAGVQLPTREDALEWFSRYQDVEIEYSTREQAGSSSTTIISAGRKP